MFVKKYLFNQEVIDIEDMVLYQKLDSYYSVLKLKARDFWIREQVVSKQRIDMQRLNDQMFKQMLDHRDDECAEA